MAFGIYLLTLLIAGVHGNAIRIESGAEIFELRSDTYLESMPTSLSMHIPLSGKTVDFALLKNRDVDPDLPVLLGTEEEAFILWENPEENTDYVVYEDPRKKASFVIWSGKKRGMMGVFDNDGQAYNIEPRDSRIIRSESGDKDDGNMQTLVTLDGVDLTLTKVSRPEMADTAAEQITSDKTGSVRKQVMDYLQKTSSNTKPPVTGISFDMGVLAVVDYSIFQKWIQFSRAMDYESREAEAINNIRYYYALVFSGVAMYYRGESTNGNSLNIRTSALYITKSTKASYWSEMAPIKQNYHFTDSQRAFDAFQAWIKKHSNDLPSHNLAMLFTSNQLFSGFSNQGRRKIVLAMTEVMNACQVGAVALAYDGGQTSAIHIATQEIGCTFGVYHKIPANGCEKGSSVPQTNPNRFPASSLKALWDILYFLEANGTNCMTADEGEWDRELYKQKYLGQRYTLDEQCMLSIGRLAYYCGAVAGEHGMCGELYCMNPYSGQCELSPRQVTADGTPCGNKQWCMTGECIKDADAPVFRDTQCLVGDSTSIVDHVKGFRCYDMGRHEPFRCYDSFFRSSCCETCRRLFIEDESAVGCEYGDKEPSLCGDNLKSSDCYNPAIAAVCCHACTRFELKQPGCKYGDKSPQCTSVSTNPALCYGLNSTCCSSCRRAQVNVSGCEWGDKENWCNMYPKSNCYDAIFAQTCCDFCKKQESSSRDCKWGDRGRDCNEVNCDENKLINCCETCQTVASESNIALHIDDSLDLLISDEACEDTSQYCHEIRGGFDCYHMHEGCCNTCKPYLTDDPACIFGDHTSWCGNFIKREGVARCDSDPVLRSECCSSCNTDRNEVDVSISRWLKVCKDQATWCADIFPGQCYDINTRRTCCMTCAGLKVKDTKCTYGDALSWCAKKYCAKHSKECCKTCKP